MTGAQLPRYSVQYTDSVTYTHTFEADNEDDAILLAGDFDWDFADEVDEWTSAYDVEEIDE